MAMHSSPAQQGRSTTTCPARPSPLPPRLAQPPPGPLRLGALAEARAAPVYCTHRTNRQVRSARRGAACAASDQPWQRCWRGSSRRARRRAAARAGPAVNNRGGRARASPAASPPLPQPLAAVSGCGLAADGALRPPRLGTALPTAAACCRRPCLQDEVGRPTCGRAALLR